MNSRKLLTGSNDIFASELFRWLMIPAGAILLALCVYKAAGGIGLSFLVAVVAAMAFTVKDYAIERAKREALVVVREGYSHGSKCVWRMDREA